MNENSSVKSFSQYDCDRTGGGEQGISMGCADTYLYTLGKFEFNLFAQ